MGEKKPIQIISLQTQTNIVLGTQIGELIKINENGDIFIRGEPAKNDNEIVVALQEYAAAVMKNNNN